MPRLSRRRALLAGAFACLALLGWQGVTTIGNGPVDSGEHLRYAEYLDAHGSLPGKARNYEYATPPLFHAVATAAEHAVRWLPSHWAELPSNVLTRALWLLLAAGGIACLTSARRWLRVAGAAALALVAVWSVDEAISLGKTQPWSAGRLVSLAACLALVLLTGLIARETWPDRPRRAVGAAAFVAAYPVVYRMGILFHPEMLLAALCALATYLFLRAARLGWPGRLGWAVGAACGAAALTRQTALVVIVCVAAAGILAGGRAARGFLLRAAVLTVLLAGPWWGYATHTWGNPLQSNLEPRASLMLDHQPPSFYVSFPLRTLVIHPYRPDFDNQLLPKLHAELWSDWFGAFHPGWSSPSRLDRVNASSQSVLGFVADALALAGLAAIGIPAAVRAFRRRCPTPRDLGLGFLSLLAVVGFTAFLVMLIRFPQREGDPIKSSYLLFTAPAWAIFSTAAWSALARRRAAAQAVLAGVAVLYVISYATELGTILSRPSGLLPSGGAAGTVELQTTIQGSAPTIYEGGDVTFAIFVANNGNQTATDTVLRVEIPRGLNLLGAPYHERGPGCTGTTSLICRLDFLPGGETTPIRFEVQASAPGDHELTASVTSSTSDIRPENNDASFTVSVPGP